MIMLSANNQILEIRIYKKKSKILKIKKYDCFGVN